MKLYEFGEGGSRKYPYASGYGPYEGMDFLEAIPEFLREMHLRSWEVSPQQAGLSVDVGSCWPDIMSCGGSLPSLVFSRKVLESLQSRDIPIKRTTFIPVGEIRSAKLKTIPPPDYFVIEALPGIRVDYAASGFAVDSSGIRIPGAPLPVPSILHYDPATWNGLDIFCEDYGDGSADYLGLIFTERIKEIAKKDRWTNVSFQRLRVKGINPFTGMPDAQW